MKTNIIFLGDSIPYGIGDQSGMGGYVNRIKNYFEKNSQGQVYIQNNSFPGAKTKDIVERCRYLIRGNHFDNTNEIIVFSIGINDTQFDGKQIDLEAFKKFELNIKSMINIAKGFSETIVFVGLTRVRQENDEIPFKWKEGKYYDNRRIQKFDAMIEEICHKEKCLYIPVAECIDNGNNLYDGLHPNDEGHNKMFSQIYADIRKEYIEPSQELTR